MGDIYIDPDVEKDMTDYLVDLVDSGSGVAQGYIEIEDAGSTVLCSIDLANPAFGAASVGTPTAPSVATLLGVPLTSAVTVTGTATTFVIKNRDGVGILSGAVRDDPASGAPMILDNVALNAGDTVTISSLTVTAPAIP